MDKKDIIKGLKKLIEDTVYSEDNNIKRYITCKDLNNFELWISILKK